MTGKRLMDVGGAAALAVVASPLLALAAVAVAATMGWPVLYRQRRAGLGGRPFTLLKLRTMRPPGVPGEPDAARLTPLGRLLRATSVDELPQLWNVLRGDMSLVGPRPLLPEYLMRYTPRQARRHEVRPGLTGLAQVAGRNAVPWPRRLALDVWYVEHHCLALDLHILLRTIRCVVAGRGIAAPGHATMPELRCDIS
jgi:sugar transferase EpsL